jgi:hypothetical protein
MAALLGKSTFHAQTDSVSGIYAVSIGLFLFSIQDVIIKSFSGKYSVLQIVFTRSVTALLIMTVVVVMVASRRFEFTNHGQ